MESYSVAVTTSLHDSKGSYQLSLLHEAISQQRTPPSPHQSPSSCSRKFFQCARQSARALLTEEEARRIAETAVDRGGAATLTPSRPEIRARRYSKCRQVTSKHLLQRVFRVNFHCVCVAHTHVCFPAHTHVCFSAHTHVCSRAHTHVCSLHTLTCVASHTHVCVLAHTHVCFRVQSRGLLRKTR